MPPALFLVPMLLADPSRFWLAQRSVGIATTFQHTVTASNVWFPFAHSSIGPTVTPQGIQTIAQYSLPGLARAPHPPAGGPARARRGGRLRTGAGGRPEEALQLLALVFLVRCVFDPLTYSYHHAPFLVALVVYEGLRRRVPVLSGFAIAAILAMTYVIAPMKRRRAR